jgi:hypothetical protein
MNEPALRASAKSNNVAMKRGGKFDRPMDPTLKIKFRVYASTTESVATEKKSGSMERF